MVMVWLPNLLEDVVEWRMEGLRSIVFTIVLLAVIWKWRQWKRERVESD